MHSLDASYSSPSVDVPDGRAARRATDPPGNRGRISSEPAWRTTALLLLHAFEKNTGTVPTSEKDLAKLGRRSHADIPVLKRILAVLDEELPIGIERQVPDEEPERELAPAPELAAA
jgi:hypothetical protein